MNKVQAPEITVIKTKLNDTPDFLIEQHIDRDKNFLQSLNIDPKDLCNVILSVLDSARMPEGDQDFSIYNLTTDDLVDSCIAHPQLIEDGAYRDNEAMNERILKFMKFKEQTSSIKGLSIMIISMPAIETNISLFSTEKLFHQSTELLYKLIQSQDKNVTLH